MDPMGKVPNSITVGSARRRLGGGWSNHVAIAVSLPVPKAFGLGWGLGLVAVLGVGLVVDCARNRCGRCWCFAHTCHGMWHWHFHLATGSDLRQMLHQSLVSNLLTSKADRLADTLWLQCGQPKKPI